MAVELDIAPLILEWVLLISLASSINQTHKQYSSTVQFKAMCAHSKTSSIMFNGDSPTQIHP